MSKTDHFYLKHDEPNKSCFLALRDILLNFDTKISETVKYGMPCFCYNNKMFCYLWTDKKTAEPYLLMVDGNLMEHPSLESGSRARMKILRVNPNEDIDLDLIHEILNLGINLFTKGIV